MLYAVAVFAPLAGALIAGLLGRAIGDRAAGRAVSILGMVVSAICGVIVMRHVAFEGAPYASVPIAVWVLSGSFLAHWVLHSAVMVGMVSVVSMLIHIYTIGDMAHKPDGSRFRFMGYNRLIMFGRLTKATLSAIQDLSPREVALFAPLVVITLWMGVYPSSFSGFWATTVATMITRHQAALRAPVTLAAVIP